jgi:hypothetical protein
MEYLWNIHMHKISLLSRGLSDFYEIFYHFLNNQLFCGHLLFHDIFTLPRVLSLIHSLFVSPTDLSFASIDNLSNFVLSSVSHYLLCMDFYLQASHSLNQYFLLPTILLSIRLCLFITNTDILTFGLFLMAIISLSFFHFLNMHS